MSSIGGWVDPVIDRERPEWQDGWPRGTWVMTIDRQVFEVFQTARGPDNALMYLIRPPVDLGGTRYVAVYAALLSEARTPDGLIYRREI